MFLILFVKCDDHMCFVETNKTMVCANDVFCLVSLI